MDCRLENTGAKARIEVSREGQEELGPVSGRGWAVIEDEELNGRITGFQSDAKAEASLSQSRRLLATAWIGDMILHCCLFCNSGRGE